ncbi:hypothetical protein ACSBR2_013620 [Camellia fascicularis]
MMMGEKQGSKGGGGYVGGFFQLFDWNAKSRKKLYLSKSDLPEQSKQKKRSDGNLPTTRFNLMEEDEPVSGSSIKGSSDYSCASSVTDEEGYKARAPGVVARLMGLDSLPTSNLTDPFSIPFFDSQSLQDAQYHRRNLQFHHDNQITHSGHLHNKVEAPIQKAMEPKPQKMINKPIEKFQSEILPPKSAKSIPITHHKLLSPIKNPGFIPSKSAAHLMEAAAKIIEQGPQVNKTKMPLLGTSSVPFKVRDLKEKMEAVQKPSSSRRPVESNPAKFLKGQSMNKSWNGSDDSEDCSGMMNKGKSISLALQAKVNVQRREGLSPSGSRGLFGQKEKREAMSSQPFKCQSNSQKSTQKKPFKHNASNVLRQNNQKQNCLIEKEKLPSKSLLSNSQGRKGLSGDSSSGRQKNPSKYGGNSKVGSRKLNPEVTDSKNEASYSSTRNVPRKKRSIDGNFRLNNDQVVDSMLVDKTEKTIQSNSVVDRHFTWAEDNKRKGLDVVSFTFTAPMTRSIPGGEISRQVVSEKNNGFCADYRGKKVLFDSKSTNSGKVSSPRCNVIGADALSSLLEQKLRELTHGESSRYRAGMVGTSALIFQNLIPTTPMSHDKRSQDGMHREKLSGQYGSNFSSIDSRGLMTKHKLKEALEMDECRSDDTETITLLQCRHPSPISVLEPSFQTESCYSSESADSNSIEGGSKHCLSSIQAIEVLGSSSSKKFHLMETDTELADSASSISIRTIARRNKTDWELEYVNDVLFNVELMFKDFALGRAREIINPHLFDQLESRKEVKESQGDDPKLTRKVLFECVSECMDLRCRRYASGGYGTWARGLSTLRRKKRLAKEVYNEISSWRGMADCMVDDLVDKDMSGNYGKWVDFEVEAFELGLEIEDQILDSLVNEVAADVFLL